jgi:hypothetical protein
MPRLASLRHRGGLIFPRHWLSGGPGIDPRALITGLRHTAFSTENFVALPSAEIKPFREYLTQALYEVITVESRQHIHHFPPGASTARSKNLRRFWTDHFAQDCETSRAFFFIWRQ